MFLLIISAAALIALVLLVIGVAYQAIGAASDRRRFAEVTHHVRLATGERIHARCEGEGTPTVILEAGIAATSLSWALVQPKVAAFTRVCSYDRSGLGRSDARSGPVSAASHASTLDALTRAMALPPPFILVGHSYGSFVVRAFAARRPGDVAGIVLVDPIHHADWVAPSRRVRRDLRGGVFMSLLGAALARVGFVRLALRLLAGGRRDTARGIGHLFGTRVAKMLEGFVGQVQKMPAGTRPLVQACWSDPKCFTSMARHLAGLPASARDVAGQSLGHLPLIVVSAALGWAARKGNQQELAALSSRGRMVVAQQSGHWTQLDDPDVVVGAIRELVDQVRAAGPN